MLTRHEPHMPVPSTMIVSSDTTVGTPAARVASAQARIIGIGPIATTRMACGPLLLEQEDRILTALEIAATARVRPDGLLELRDADGRGVLRATRAPEQP